ncbi:hypothetical protein IK110_02160 [Candidatus Saccharibacteria bacterium]|nr:hypothetical protein [Candidatus Saccharibacteria bacterium]
MIVIWGLIVAFISSAIIINIVANANPNSTIMNLSFAPSTAIVKVSGVEYRNGSYELAPGTYHIEASAEGFEDKAFDINIENGKSNDVLFYLETTSGDMSYYERSNVDLKTMRLIAKSDESAKVFIESYDKKYRLITDTPIKETYITPAGYANEMRITNARSDKRCKGTLCILISGYAASESSFKMQAIKMLTSRGYNINDYEVFYEYK